MYFWCLGMLHSITRTGPSFPKGRSSPTAHGPDATAHGHTAVCCHVAGTRAQERNFLSSKKKKEREGLSQWPACLQAAVYLYRQSCCAFGLRNAESDLTIVCSEQKVALALPCSRPPAISQSPSFAFVILDLCRRSNGGMSSVH